MRYVKGRIFRKTVRVLCKFPRTIRLFYNFYKKLIIFNPFLRTSFKWKMIRVRLINFEVNRTLYKRGYPAEKNILFEVTYKAGKPLNDYKYKKRASGRYKLDVEVSGLSIEGRIISSNTETVNVKINNKIVRKITVKGRSRFLLRIKNQLLCKLPKNSVLSLELDNGKKLVYKNSDHVLLSIPFGSGNFNDLIESGFLLSKKGTFTESEDDLKIRQKKFLDLYSCVKDVFDRETGIQLFLMYGTLLGQTREGYFIANDDDFDAGYISLKNDPKEVKKETVEIVLKLLRKGFDITVNPIGRLFKITKSDTDVHLDIMPVWFEDGWNVAFGGAGVKSSTEDYLPVKKGLMRTHEVYIPKKPEVFLSGYYGADWRIPDPGYVSNYKQTGKTLLKSYSKYMMTPHEFDKVSRIVEAERKNNPGLGNFSAIAYIS